MNRGIDYGLGQTNIDHDNGIRYGVIPANDLGESWYESSEGDWRLRTCACPKCGNEAVPIDAEGVPDLDGPDYDENDNPIELEWDDEGRDYACLDCRYSFDSDQAFGEEPIGFDLDDGEYLAASRRRRLRHLRYEESLLHVRTFLLALCAGCSLSAQW